MPIFNMRLTEKQADRLKQIASYYSITKTAVIEMWIARWHPRNVKTERKDGTRRTSSVVVASSSSEKTISSSEPSAEAFVLARCLVGSLLKNNPKHRLIEESTVRRWAKVADLMHGRDGRSWEDMAALMDWCQRDGFWHKNILSMEKFREKFDQLVLKAPVLLLTPQRSLVEEPKPPTREELETLAWMEQHSTLHKETQ